MTENIIENYLSDTTKSFHNYKKMAEKALSQISDEEFFRALDAESNSIALIVKHITGNQRSRWRFFLTTDGEKNDRYRDKEFLQFEEDSRESLMNAWENGWEILFEAVEYLTVEDFSKTVPIRGEHHTIVEAINRQLTHYAFHIGQIVFLAKHFRSENWQTLTIPKNKSVEFNKFLEEKRESGKSKTHYLDAPQEFAEKENK